jgi:hypothetical protein
MGIALIKTIRNRTPVQFLGSVGLLTGWFGEQFLLRCNKRARRPFARREAWEGI